MAHCSGGWLLSLLIILLALSVQTSQARVTIENGVKSSVFLSPKFVLEPGSVANKYYYNVDFPRGHIAIKSFDAEVVDEAGNPVPLHETYLHHWVVVRYYQRRSVEIPKYNDSHGFKLFDQSDFIPVRNSGICDRGLSQYFGLGSETRKTATHVPDPYGIEVGNPAEIPAGYEEKWLMNVHAIDTRGVEDRLGCTECRCDLYNVTEDEYGRPLKPGYMGGLRCCYDETQCRVREGVEITKRGLYMRYTVTWVDWNNYIVPVKIYIFDVTDIWKKLDDGLTSHFCQVEFDVDACTATGEANDGCIDTKRVSFSMPTGGDVIYSVAHQHTGGNGSTLYGEDGRVICHSTPTYGEGKEVGNEAGYIVGMSTCYPQPGSVKISDGETLVLESNYSSARRHTGVMGLFYILVADSSPHPNSSLPAPVEEHEKMTLPHSVWGIAFFGAAIAVAAVVAHRRKREQEDGYHPILT